MVALPCVEGLSDLSDEDLLALHRSAGAVRQQVDARLAAISGELARRSDRALGHNGLASRLGAASAEKAIQVLTGVSFSEARALATVGAAAGSPWLAPMQQAVQDGTLSVASAAAITAGLGAPSDRVAADDLQDAAAALVEFAVSSTPEHTGKAARQMRDRLDIAGVDDLEAHRRSQRSLKWYIRADGMQVTTIISDPESAAELIGPVQAMLSPRLGGPRFTDPDEAERARSVVDDPRSNEQLAHDALLDLVRLGVRAAGTDIDPQKLLGTRSPAVRVHVQAESLHDGNGVAYLEGQPAAISIQTAKRYLCDTGYLPIIFRQNKAIATGETQRLHSIKDRIALAAHWNGCPVGDCDRPPSMTEVHHIEPWNGHNTTLTNGIPLCRFHHTELHANKWTIRRDPDHTYWLVPQPGLAQEPIPLRSRNPLTRL